MSDDACPVCQGTGKTMHVSWTVGGLTGLGPEIPGFDALTEAISYRIADSVSADVAIDIAEDMAEAYFSGFFHAFGEAQS